MARQKKKSRKGKKASSAPSALYVLGVVVLLAAIVYFAASLYGIFGPRSSREIESAVLVLNGCGEEGIGLRTARYLRERGLDVVDFRNADSFNYEETIVVDRSGDFGAAVRVARMLHIPNVIQQVPETPLVDIIIIVGADHSWFESS